MSKDIVPELLAEIEADFRDRVSRSEVLQQTFDQLRSGKATYETAGAQADELGKILAEVLRDHLSGDVLPDGRMYYNIANRILQPTLERNYQLVATYAKEMQQELNRQAGIGIRAQKAELNQDRIDGIVDKVSEAEQFDDVKWMIDEPVKNFSRSIVDDTAKVNAEFHHKAGLKARVIRKSSGHCCDWCNAVAGTYTYPDVPKDVFRRHRHCDCVVEYDPGDGKRKNVYTKKESDSAEDKAIRIRQSQRWIEQDKKDREHRKAALKSLDQKSLESRTPSSPAKPYAKELIATAKNKDKVITEDLKEAVKSGHGNLVGLEYRIKGEDSLSRKLEGKAISKGISIKAYAEQVTDVLRYTNSSKPEHLTEDFFNIVGELEKKGYNLIEVTNTFNVPGSPYRGINTLVKDRSGYVFELQFHTPESLEVKEINHKLYVEQRLTATAEFRKAELKKKMKENSMKILMPSDIERIHNLGGK